MQGRLQAGAGCAFEIPGTQRREPAKQAVQAEAEQDQQQDRKPDRFEQHRAKRRREHLREGFCGVGEHVWTSNRLAPSAQLSSSAKADDSVIAHLPIARWCLLGPRFRGDDDVGAYAATRLRPRLAGCGTSVASPDTSSGATSSSAARAA